MKKRFVLALALLVVLFLIVQYSLNRTNIDTQQQKALDGWYTLLPYLPTLPQFEIVGKLHAESHFTAYGKTCYYAHGYIVIGTSLTEVEAIDSYKAALPSFGWKVSERWPIGSVFYRGENDQLNIDRSFNTPPPVISDSLDYASLKQKYNTLIFIGLDYMLPARDGC